MSEILKDQDRRVFSGWGTISVVDRQNDYIDVLKEFRDKGIMEIMMKRGAPVVDSHSNHQIGRIISFEYKIAPSGKPGLYLTAEVFKNYPSDDDVWNAIKEGKYSGFSLGGKAADKTPVCNIDGCHNNLTGIESWEWSIVETPANQEALIDNVNKLAKSYKLYKCYPIQKCVRRCGDKFCVYSEEGKRLGTHATEEDANEQLIAIEVNKGFFSSVLSSFDSMGDYTLDEWIEEHWQASKHPDSAWSDKIKEAWNKKTEEYNSRIHKAKVYIKTPSEAPSGAKLFTGERGGQYYESEPGKPQQQMPVQTQVQTPVEQPKFQSKNSIWDKYAEGMKNDPDGKINEAYWKEKTEWTHNIQRALSLNEISEADARKLGWYGTEAVQPLPQVLYHVTTAKDAVERTGLKTRDELNMESGLGLGGGQSDTVSFTENPEIAKAIKTVMIEAQKVASGQITLKDLINQAKIGTGAKKPWYDEWEKSSKLTYGTQLEDTLNSIDHDQSFRAETPEDYNAGKSKMNYPTGWVGAGEPTIFSDGTKKWNRWVKQLSPEEIKENTFELYKFWLPYREYAGGIMDPLFFSSDPKALAKIDPSQIETLQFKSKPGAKGFQMSALGEWRTWSGDTVQLAGIKKFLVHKAKVYVKNPQDVPPGYKVNRGKHGGLYYESEARESATEQPEKPWGLSLKPTVYDNYDKMLHFETGKKVLVNFLHNTEKAPDMGSRFGQDIEPSGKYVILDEVGGTPPPGWETGIRVLHHPLVIEWKDWKKNVSVYFGKTGKELNAALVNWGYDSIVTIDGDHVSEIVLLVPKTETYDELKKSEHYKGEKKEWSQLLGNYIHYDIFNFNSVNVEVHREDLPTNIAKKVMMCSEAFKFSLLKNIPKIQFAGKSVHKPFSWTDRSGVLHNSEAAGTAFYGSDNPADNMIDIWDDFGTYDVVYHEVGHFVYHKLFGNNSNITIDGSVKGFESVENIKDYYKMIDILKNHNVPITVENINGLLDDVDYAKNLNILDDMNENKLRYYDNAYAALCAMRDRVKVGYTPDLSPYEEKQWKKYRTEFKAYLKANEMRNEWHEIWQTEGYTDHEYANRNNEETFAEFYQTMDHILREHDEGLLRDGLINRLALQHPKKTWFFKKFVLNKILTNKKKQQVPQ